MKISQSSPLETDEIVLRLQTLVQTERKARLLALLPLVDSLHRQGVGFGAMAEQLKAAELDVTEAALRMALYRWRKKNRLASNNPSAIPSRQAAAAASPATPSAPSSAELPAGSTCEISNKADLVRLRQSQEHIDLNQLANYGRKK